MQIQWYPGHMTKAKRMLTENLKLIDVVVELVDARAPLSTRNRDFDELFTGKYRVVLLNKSDLANSDTTAKWISYYKSIGIEADDFVATRANKRKSAINAIERAASEKVERMRQKGVIKTVRAMIVGIPNVGKSTLINTIAGFSRAAVGDKPGVTQGKQWVKITDRLELLDTPGLLWPKFEDQTVAKRIAYIGSVRDDILDYEELASDLLSELLLICPQAVTSRYPLVTKDTPKAEILTAVCDSRGFVQGKGVANTERAARVVLDEFRGGKIARVTFESPDDLTEE